MNPQFNLLSHRRYGVVVFSISQKDAGEGLLLGYGGSCNIGSDFIEWVERVSRGRKLLFGRLWMTMTDGLTRDGIH